MIASEAVTAINHWSIFRVEISIALACRRHHGARQRPTLREPITPRLSPRPRCAMLPRLAVVDAVDVHHSTTCCHHPAAAPKTMSQEVKRCRKRRHRPIRDIQIWGSPGAAHVNRRVDCKGDAFNKLTVHRCCHHLPRLESKLVFTGSHVSPTRC
jgi:hypothetical protein